MKIKNIAVGSYVQSKKDSKQLMAGHCYQVAEKDVSDKTVRLFSVDGSFDDSLWFCVNDFRKPRPQPQLKQLDQSVFDGLDEKWRFAAIDGERGIVAVFDLRPMPSLFNNYHTNTGEGNYKDLYELTGYDASNWQNSLIERDTAKELLEVDLSSELTGSELCKAMLARGDKYVLCHLSQTSEKSAKDVLGIAIGHDHSGFRVQRHNSWQYAVPINNQGEPLTSSEVGL